MAVDKKSDYYTSSNTYTDLDGNLKTFTVVDHDRHTSRLKSWNYDRKEVELTDLQKLVELICSSEINSDPEFITKYDTVFAEKYQFERAKKGSDVLAIQMDRPYDGDEWYNDLKQLYDRLQKKLTGEDN